MTARYHRSSLRSYQNPYFSRAKSKKRWPHRLAWASGVLLFVATLWFYMSPVFAVHGLIIEGAIPDTARTVAAVVSNHLQSRFLGRARGSHWLLVSGKTMERELSDHLFVERVTLDISWRGVITVTVVERNPGFILETGERWFLTDREGFIMTELPRDIAAQIAVDRLAPQNNPPTTSTIYFSRGIFSTTTPQFPVLKVSILTATPTPRLPSLPDSLRPFFREILSRRHDFTAADITSLSLGTASGTTSVTLHTSEGWFIQTSNERSLDTQIKALKQVLSELSIDRSKLEYVDVRFRDRVYYKEK